MDRRIFDMMNMYDEPTHQKNYMDMSCDMNSDYCRPTPPEFNNGILTMAFVNMQPLESVYETEKGFNRGSLFSNLDKPLHVYGGYDK